MPGGVDRAPVVPLWMVVFHGMLLGMYSSTNAVLTDSYSEL